MFKLTLKPSTLFLSLTLFFVLLSSAQAQSSTGWNAAKQLQDSLFEAQTALQQGDQVAAQHYVQNSTVQFAADLAPMLNSVAPDLAARIQSSLATANTAVRQNDAVTLATQRGQIHAALMLVGYQLTLHAIEQDHPDEAQAWLLLRAYRPSTRFSRPNANATLAVEALRTGQISSSEAAAAVKADLLDTYQAELNRALATVAEATEKEFRLRQAETAGLAQGYWLILRPAYVDQFGEADTATVDRAFQALLAAKQPEQIQPILDNLNNILQNFRAAPLSEQEQARRASQMLRFLTLVPVEYHRGVRDGQVFLQLEIQEAVTFLAGAAAAFADLQLPLQTIDPAATAEVETLLQEIAQDLDAANRGTVAIDPNTLENKVNSVLIQLRDILPEAWQQTNNDADFDVIASVLDRMESAVAAGQYRQAETARLEAYAIFDSGPELRLQALAPELVAQGDGLFWHGYNNNQTGLAEAIANQATLAEIKIVRTNLDEVLNQSQRVLGHGSSAPAAVVLNAAIIVFREGLEAVVILAALMASLVGAYAGYRKPMVWGVVAALGVTVLTWIIAQQILIALGGLGEKLEAVVSIIAIGVLLIITNWFFHKIYWKDWLKNFHQQKKEILSRQVSQFVGLLLLGFTSVYREGFETVLFLQALVLDAGTLVVLQGIAMGLLGVGVVGFITFKLQQTLPYKKMLVATGILIGGVLLVMVGNTVHVLQAVNWLTFTPIHGLSIPYQLGLWFGLYPTWEGFAAQIAAAIFVIGSYYLAEFKTHRKRQATPIKKSELKTIS